MGVFSNMWAETFKKSFFSMKNIQPWRLCGADLFLSPAPGSVEYLNSVLINLLPRIGMSRVDNVTSAARSTRRTVCTGGGWETKKDGGCCLPRQRAAWCEPSNCSLAWSDCDWSNFWGALCLLLGHSLPTPQHCTQTEIRCYRSSMVVCHIERERSSLFVKHKNYFKLSVSLSPVCWQS